ncbi:MAG: hypothetical protein AB8V79_04355 [Candidatus Midichloria sp.]
MAIEGGATVSETPLHPCGSIITNNGSVICDDDLICEETVINSPDPQFCIYDDLVTY